MSNEPRELAAEELWDPCALEGLDFETTEALPDAVTIIGQKRAVQAIDFGVGIASHGFNIYALGAAGTGRATTIDAFLDRVETSQCPAIGFMLTISPIQTAQMPSHSPRAQPSTSAATWRNS